MQTANRFSRILSILLAVIFLFTLLTPVAASEMEEGAPPPETAATEASVPETTIQSTEETIVSTESAETEPFSEDTQPEETLPVPELSSEPGFSCPYDLYFGLLHAHTDISDGLGTVEEAFAHAAAVEGLDFFAVTDHSNSFDNADSGVITLDGCTLSEEWAAGKAAAAAVTDESFLGIFGYEITWPEIRQLGHITTYNTPGWISRDQKGFANDAKALEHYLQALTTVPGSVSQFCHPGALFGEFDSFGHWQSEYDDTVQLLETLGEGSLRSYIQALDRYWHVAPTATQNNHNGLWGDQNHLRTVVLAEALTEESLFDAIQHRRVYATEDRDLHIFYELDGHSMGSVLSDADNPLIAVSLYDPTDTAIGTVEVVAESGVTVASQQAEGNDTTLTIPVPGGYRWYFLKITQSDGDIAVTAPVWVEGFDDMGISGFTAEEQLPIQGQPVNLELTLFNNENIDLELTALEFYQGDALIHREDDPEIVSPGTTLIRSVSYAHPHAGIARIRALVRGTVLGWEQAWEAELSLRFRSAQTVTDMLVDGSHDNLDLDLLTRLAALAREIGMDMTIFSEAMPQGGTLLVIPPMQMDPDSGFLEDLLSFLKSGGSILLWDDGSRGNLLLEAIGATLRFGSKQIPAGFSSVFHTNFSWCAGLAEGQFFHHPEGCDLDPGSGDWLVKDAAGESVLLACEQTPYGGMIFAAGCPFLRDSELPLPESRWELPRANQTLLQAILGAEAKILEQTAIREVRDGTEGEVYRVKGYVTAGTSKPHTTFPNTLYLQDDTGGIAVTDFTIPQIQIGAPLEIIGTLTTEHGNPVLKYVDHRLGEEAYYRFTPRTMGCKTATDYEEHGGELVQTEGEVTALTLTPDRKGISRLEVTDILGNTAIIEIEDGIGSGTDGVNALAKTIKKGRTVRAMGLLHINEAGEVVLRVRNCDEIVYLPAKADPTNPKTADPFWWIW